MNNLTPAVPQMSTISQFELAFFRKKLGLVTRVLGNLEVIKLYGRKKVLDLGKLESKSTKSNTTPDIVDLQAIDMDRDLRRLLFELCREYEETVYVPVTDKQGNVTGQVLLPPVESSDPAVMVEYLSDTDSLQWMRYQQDFEDRACEIIELIDAAIKYTTNEKIEKPRPVLGLEKVIAKMRAENSIEDYPRTPVQIVRMINSMGYPLKLKSVTKWIENGNLEYVSMIGKRKAYLPTDVMEVYLKSMKRAAQATFVNRVA